MTPPDTFVASVILSELHLNPVSDGDTWDIQVSGRGTLAPGVVVPNEWWDRPSFIDKMQVDKPRCNKHGIYTVNFWCSCRPEHADEIRKLVDAGVRELIEREIVPPLLAKLALVWSGSLDPLPPVSHPFGTPVDWDPPIEPVRRSRAAIIHDLVRLSVSQPPSIPRDQVLQEAAEHGMLANPGLALLVAKAGLAPPAVAENSGPVVRRTRVRVIDV
jgi:hypothetical protein